MARWPKKWSNHSPSSGRSLWARSRSTPTGCSHAADCSHGGLFSVRGVLCLPSTHHCCGVFRHLQAGVQQGSSACCVSTDELTLATHPQAELEPLKDQKVAVRLVPDEGMDDWGATLGDGLQCKARVSLLIHVRSVTESASGVRWNRRSSRHKPSYSVRKGPLYLRRDARSPFRCTGRCV